MPKKPETDLKRMPAGWENDQFLFSTTQTGAIRTIAPVFLCRLASKAEANSGKNMPFLAKGMKTI